LDESQLYSRVGKKVVHSLYGLKLALTSAELSSSLRFTSAGLSQTYTGWLTVTSVVGHAPTPGEPIMATT
jgi:hypothetical protein